MNSPRLFPVFLLLILLASLPELDAQVGNNNPTGVSGVFNGNVTTGCSYDPYTGNAHRTITDIVVAGAVGQYPLALTRTSNSRDAAGSAFGLPGAWRHNYQWTIENVSTWHQDMHYTVHFPDGRIENFIYSAADVDYRAAPGVRERLEPWTTTNGTTGFCYLVLPDGGKVEFYGTRTLMTDPDLIPPNWYEFTFVATAIIDPYGQRTTFTYDTSSRLSKVTEPAGRYLQFYYRTQPGQTNIVDKVTASDGRIVQYTYTTSPFPPGTTSYTALTSVVYYSTWTASYTYKSPNNAANANGVPLLLTADDPMYSGPMRRIGYVYKTGNNPDGKAAVYGQLLSENYYDGTAIGAAVSTLEITNATTRKETRGDGKTRTFTYLATGYLSSLTDFMGHSASQTYDVNKYITSVTDRNGKRTDFTSNALNGNMTVTTFPLTPNDTQPPQSVRSTIQYTYGSASCADPHNQDDDNPYYVCTAKDEGGHVTQFWRDTNKRVTKIDYPDGGYETFSYDASHFYQLSSHRMTTGGTESFTYDTRGLKQDYRNPSNATGNPTARYQYDGYDRVTGVTDVLGTAPGDISHTTNFAYNLRGQVTVTTLPTDPIDGGRHTIVNTYNPNGDGTLLSVTDQLNHVTSYIYDNYRRVKSVTTPARYAGDSTNHTTEFSYYVNGMWDDYSHTDSNVAWVHLPSGKWINTVYDDNRRKTDVTVGWNTTEAATTRYDYDNVGNVTSVTDPLDHITTTVYDERNRPSSITRPGHMTTFKYDLAGRKKSVTRPNEQAITFDTFDAMNRVLQQTVKQTPDPDAVTKYTYTTAGLLETMQDPRLVATNSSENYSYEYDTTGRKKKVTYPLDSFNVRRTEQFSYNTAGRLGTFINRNGKTQTFTYDALNRMKYFIWNDGLTPRVDFGYDVASRLTTINNANASISRVYFNDNLPNSETETITGGVARPVTYTYNADGNRDSLQFPSYSFTYDYTGRNQLKNIKSGPTTLATYGYDLNGNLTSRDVNTSNSTKSTYEYDELDRVTHIEHLLSGPSRTFDYGYDPVGNRLWTKWANDYGDVFAYDLNDQAIGVQLDVAHPDTVPGLGRSIEYDANGNRTIFWGEWYLVYTTNDLNQYTLRARPSPPPRPGPIIPDDPSKPAFPRPTPGPTPPDNVTPVYDFNGNPTTGLDGSIYTYDAHNRLLTASKSGVTYTFKYDGLNRQVSRTVGGVTTYSVWDGWDLVEEYQGAGTVVAAYLHGASGLVKNLVTNNYYYQDGSGSTSHLANSSGALLEWYRYDLHGTPIIYDPNDSLLPVSAFGIRHLFTGQQWYSELGLYDLRNRFYSPDIGRFLQPDPIGFWGDGSNLYRYCGNNPVKWRDPSGLQVFTQQYGNAESDNVPAGDYTPLGPNGGYTPEGGFEYHMPDDTGNGTAGGSTGAPGVSVGGGDLGMGPGGREFGSYASDHVGGSGSRGDGGGGGGGGLSLVLSVRQAVVVTLPYGTSYMPMTTVKNLAQAQRLGVFIESAVPIFVPSGQNPQATINGWGAARGPSILTSFFSAFQPGGPNDFKLISPIYDPYGNFIYGASGQAAGIPSSLLQGMGHLIHGGQNNPINVFDIQLGIDAVRMGGVISVVPVDYPDL